MAFFPLFDISYTLCFNFRVKRTKDKRFKKDYSKKDILNYLKGVYNILQRPPTFRDLKKFPGPSSRTIVRRFVLWSKALKEAGIRPQTNQLMQGERSFIRINWRKMTDKQIGKRIGVSEDVIKYYRMNYRLWKNRKGTAKSTFRKKAIKIYGKACEVCGLKITEWHHIIPKSILPEHWCILCPLCHEVITRKLVTVRSREEIETKLLPFMKQVYSDLKVV